MSGRFGWVGEEAVGLFYERSDRQLDFFERLVLLVDLVFDLFPLLFDFPFLPLLFVSTAWPVGLDFFVDEALCWDPSDLFGFDRSSFELRRLIWLTRPLVFFETALLIRSWRSFGWTVGSSSTIIWLVSFKWVVVSSVMNLTPCVLRSILIVAKEDNAPAFEENLFYII